MGNADRLVGIALSLGADDEWLESALAYERFGRVVSDVLGARPAQFHWRYRIRFGVV
jgi:hypothetical protein